MPPCPASCWHINRSFHTEGVHDEAHADAVRDRTDRRLRPPTHPNEAELAVKERMESLQSLLTSQGEEAVYTECLGPSGPRRMRGYYVYCNIGTGSKKDATTGRHHRYSILEVFAFTEDPDPQYHRFIGGVEATAYLTRDVDNPTSAEQET